MNRATAAQSVGEGKSATGLDDAQHPVPHGPRRDAVTLGDLDE